jgi:hypothetical protein
MLGSLRNGDRFGAGSEMSGLSVDTVSSRVALPGTAAVYRMRCRPRRDRGARAADHGGVAAFEVSVRHAKPIDHGRAGDPMSPRR